MNIGYANQNSSASLLHRYPGTKPFTTDERGIFFGRDEDIAKLMELIQLEKLVVLYGQSGMGKSSLINAGLLPRLDADKQYASHLIRFGAYRASSSVTPLDSAIAQITAQGAPHTVLNKINPEDNSLWFHLKSEQMTHPENQGIILFIDQFEELFTYPEMDIYLFKQQLADALNTKIPTAFREALRTKVSTDREILTKEEVNQLYQPLQIKVLIGIRSDKMNLLNRLTDTLPDILQKCYELSALSSQQAISAITNPSQADGDFVTPKFTYTPEAIDKLIQFLSSRYNVAGTTASKSIESSNLQIICSYVESQIVSKGNTVIDINDLGDLELVIEGYYISRLNELQLDEDSLKHIREFVEEGLIFEADERRLTLYEGQITSTYKIDTNTLAKLVNSRLIRAVPLPGGGNAYEISHDTLVKPILKAKRRREEREAEQARQREVQFLMQQQQQENVMLQQKIESERAEAFRAKQEEIQKLNEEKEIQRKAQELKEVKKTKKMLTFFLAFTLPLSAFAIWQWIQAYTQKTKIENARHYLLSGSPKQIDSATTLLNVPQTILDSIVFMNSDVFAQQQQLQKLAVSEVSDNSKIALKLDSLSQQFTHLKNEYTKLNNSYNTLYKENKKLRDELQQISRQPITNSTSTLPQPETYQKTIQDIQRIDTKTLTPEQRILQQLKAGNYRDALPQALELVQQEPKNAEANLLVALAYCQTNNRPEALKYFLISRQLGINLIQRSKEEYLLAKCLSPRDLEQIQNNKYKQ
jgi:hypothetical protein